MKTFINKKYMYIVKVISMSFIINLKQNQKIVIMVVL